MLNWTATKSEYRLISKIARRAVNKWQHLNHQHVEMDISAAHCNGCPMDLQKLLDADDFNFAHDVLGIRKHLDRETGKLRDCFLPRFAGRVVEIH